jgi:hypothetical protein
MPPPSEFDQEMRALESEIKRLEAEYNMFFAGRLPRLPWERKSRVENMVRAFDRKEKRNTADRFRFQTLQARFVKFLELWERQLRDREEGGRSKVRRGRAAPLPLAEPAAAAPVAEPPAERELHVMRLRASATADGQVKELYERLAEAKRAVGETPLPFDRVAALVNAQLQKHAERGEDVAFRIAVKEGKVSLSVKSAKDES